MGLRRHATTAASSIALLLASCGGEASANAWLELGTGEWRFEPLVDGQDIEMIHGAQGGFHLWTSFRSRGLGPDRVALQIETQTEGREPDQSRVVVDLDHDEGNDFDVFVGWPAILPEPGCYVDHLATVRATVSDDHASATDERTVMVRPSPSPPPACASP